jgi:hypothetical protein
LTVQVADGVPLRIDGNEAPKRQGGTVRLALPPGVHLVSAGVGEDARPRIIEVRAGRATNVSLVGP